MIGINHKVNFVCINHLAYGLYYCDIVRQSEAQLDLHGSETIRLVLQGFLDEPRCFTLTGQTIKPGGIRLNTSTLSAAE